MRSPCIAPILVALLLSTCGTLPTSQTMRAPQGPFTAALSSAPAQASTNATRTDRQTSEYLSPSRPPSSSPSDTSTQEAPQELSVQRIAAPIRTPAPTASPRPTATPKPAKLSPPVRLVIADIKLDRSLMSVGLDKHRVPIVPKHDVGWYNLSALPGQGENIVLWGHVLRFKNAPKIPAPFARLKELNVGAKIVLYDKAGKAHHYQVTQQVWATPDQVEYILPQGKERITMVSCIGDKVVANGEVEMTNRLITIAEPSS